VAGAGDHGIVEEAERVADEVGLQQLTIAALPQRLGVRQPSFYKHIDGMDGLQRSIALRAKNELADTLARAAVGRSCGDAIVSMSQAVDASLALRSALHGSVSLEAGGGFGLPLDVDRSSDRLVSGLVTALSGWQTRDSATSPSRRRDRKGAVRGRDGGAR
jgi:AcrR family transcriptional regulator